MSERASGIIAWFARNPVAANLLMAGIFFLGTLSALSIKKEFFPEFSLNVIVIRVPYLGAAPQEVEEGVCIKVEEAIQDLVGIKRIRSRADEGIGTVMVEVESDHSVAMLLDRIKLRIDAISTFPEDTEKPVIYEETTEIEVMWVQIYGDIDERTLKEMGRDARDEIVALQGVTRAQIRGDRSYEISIEVSEENLRQYSLTFDEVVRAVRSSSLDLPAGGEILLRTKGQAYDEEDFERLSLITREDGTRLLLGDVATVVDGFEEVNRRVRFDGKESVSIQISRVGKQSALEIAKAIKKYVIRKQKELPEGVQISAWADGARLLKDRLNLMIRNAFFGGLLVFLSLTLLLRFKVAFWVIVGLPVCFLGTLWLMPLPFIDISINMITLFGFILVLGIVVDDAIVIGESVFATIRREGHTLENVIKGAQEVAMPATFGVLTTVAAFIPMLMVPGPNGKIWGGIGMVVILCLVFSLIESKLILPSHLGHMKVSDLEKGEMGRLARFQRSIADGLEAFVERHYRPLLDRSLRNRYTTIAFFVASLILTYGVIKGDVVRFVFFPDVETDFPAVELSMAEGTPGEVTQVEALKIEKAIQRVDDEIFAEEGERVLVHVLTLIESDTHASLIVELTPSEDREVGSVEITNRWRDLVGEIPGAIDLRFSGTISHSGRPIHFQLSSNSYARLNEAAARLKEKLAEYEGVFDIRDSQSRGKQEVRLNIKPGAEALGLTLNDLARQVRQGFYGAEAQRIQRGQDEVRVMVRYPRSDRRSLGHLENMRIRTPGGDEVPFSSVADAELGRGYSGIRRVDRKRVVNVTADVDKGLIGPQEVIKEVRREFMPDLLVRYPSVRYTLEGESREQKEALSSLSEGAGLAIVIIFALMAVPLKSYIKPLIIMSVIPFGIVGAAIGHLIMGMPISILSLCGIIALTGVVVNDSLVMVDFINRYEARGHPKIEAIKEAGLRRFRPIFLTSLTTFLGLTPMLLERSLQAKFLIPMAVSLAFGIVFATFITLLLIPSLYLMIDDIANLWRKRVEGRGAGGKSRSNVDVLAVDGKEETVLSGVERVRE